MSRFLILLSSCVFIFACKKEKLDPAQVPVALIEEADFTMEASDFNYPVGTTWAYSVSTQTQTFYQNSQTPQTNYGSGNYSVKVIRDSNVAGTTTGKVLQYLVNNTLYGFKELQYVNPSTNMFHQITLSSVNGNTIAPNGFCIQLPLSTISKWKNLYYPLESHIDSFNAIGFENLMVNPGYLKCIDFNANNVENKYWYNKRVGFVKGESVDYSHSVWTTAVVETTTITLTKFN